MTRHRMAPPARGSFALRKLLGLSLLCSTACAPAASVSPAVPVSSGPKAAADAGFEDGARPPASGETAERTQVDAADPTDTDPDKYHTILDNEFVRVLRYHDTPGARTQLHHHPDFVLYSLSSFRRRLTFGDGTTKERAFEPGDVIWMKAQEHIGENIGSTDTDVVVIELKRP